MEEAREQGPEGKEINHADMVAQLAKPGDDILETMSGAKMHLLHMVIGISGEVAEYTLANGSENALEELGDIEFYIEGLRQGISADRVSIIASYPPTVEELAATSLVSSAGDILDYVKKFVVYNKPFNDVEHKLLVSMAIFESHLMVCRTAWGFSHQQTLDANIQKLGHRYEGHNYTDKAANERADKA